MTTVRRAHALEMAAAAVMVSLGSSMAEAGALAAESVCEQPGCRAPGPCTGCGRARAARDDETLLVGPAAELVGVHPDTLRRWAAAGKVPVLRTPTNQRRFLVGDLRALIKPENVDDPHQIARAGDG